MIRFVKFSVSINGNKDIDEMLVQIGVNRGVKQCSLFKPLTPDAPISRKKKVERLTAVFILLDNLFIILNKINRSFLNLRGESHEITENKEREKKKENFKNIFRGIHNLISDYISSHQILQFCIKYFRVNIMRYCLAEFSFLIQQIDIGGVSD